MPAPAHDLLSSDLDSEEEPLPPTSTKRKMESSSSKTGTGGRANAKKSRAGGPPSLEAAPSSDEDEDPTPQSQNVSAIIATLSAAIEKEKKREARMIEKEQASAREQAFDEAQRQIFAAKAKYEAEIAKIGKDASAKVHATAKRLKQSEEALSQSAAVLINDLKAQIKKTKSASAASAQDIRDVEAAQERILAGHDAALAKISEHYKLQVTTLIGHQPDFGEILQAISKVAQSYEVSGAATKSARR